MPEASLQIQQLRQVRQAIESFFYKNKFNLALYKIINSQKTVNFKKKVKEGLYNQVLYFAKVEKVDQIVGVSGLGKAVKILTEKDLLERLEKLWIPLYGFLDEESVHAYMLWAGEKGGQGAMGKLRTSRDFELTNNKLKAELISLTDTLTKQIDGTTKDWLARTIEQGFRDNLSHFEIAKLIRNSASAVALERSEVIAEQEAAIAVGEVEMEVYKRNGIKEFRWETQKDERTCLECLANEEAGIIKVGEVFPSGVVAPPGHVNCILPGQQVWGLGISAKIISDYDGPAVRITTAKGSNCSVTPNHLMLTQRGWIRASEINHRDYLINTHPAIKNMPFANPNIKPIETLIDDIFVSGDVVFSKMPSPAIDFRGDEVFCKNVDIVFSTGKLRPNIFNKFFKFLYNRNFIRTLVKKDFFSCYRKITQSFKTNWFTLDCFMRRLGIFNIFFLRSLGHHDSVGFRVVSDLNFISDKKISNSGSTDTSILGDFVGRNPTFVFLDKVNEINRIKNFHGKVYDLSTGGQWYTVNGIITHNCRCFVMPAAKETQIVWTGN
jgi:hypothetical protein